MEELEQDYSTSIAEAVEEINKKKAEGEKIHPLTEEGLKAIEFANNIVSSIMNNNRPDLGYFKIYMNSTSSRISKMDQAFGPGKKKTPQEQSLRSFRRKRSNRVNNGNDTT